MFSPRSIIEVVLPGGIGSGLSDFIFWPVPFYQIPLILAAPFAIGLIWFFKYSRGLCIAVCVLLYFGTMFNQTHSQYVYHSGPYQVQDEAKSQQEAAWRARNPGEPALNYRAGYAWEDDDFLFGESSPGWSVINPVLHTQPVDGKISQEEATYEFRFQNEAHYLIVSHVIPPGTFISMSGAIRDYLADRQARLQAIAPLRNGGFMDRYHYRAAVDKINGEDTPLTLYINMRDAEQNKINGEFYGPILYGVVAFLIFGFSGKYIIKYYGAFQDSRNTRGFEALFGAYTHARVDKEGLQVDGPIKLHYPRMYINDTPFDLTDAYLDKDDHTLLTLKKYIQVRLYVGTTTINTHQDAPIPKKPKFTWDYVAPNQEESKPKPSSARRSIFETHY